MHPASSHVGSRLPVSARVMVNRPMIHWRMGDISGMQVVYIAVNKNGEIFCTSSISTPTMGATAK